ncbi:MAG TPA: AAA family ATPase [Promineifilum sp.]|nr:AAA family ATPase [Promineifilum sp.]
MKKFEFSFSDQSNTEFLMVSQWINSGEKNIAIYGEAGTGKSSFIREMTSYCEKMKFKILCLAFTGRAAGGIDGRTLHSYFGLTIRPYLPTESIFDRSTYGQLAARGTKLIGTVIKDDGREVQYIIPTLNDSFRIIELELKQLDILVIDEISMVRCDIIDTVDIILRKVRECDEPFGGVVFLMVGDKRQLPPVVSDSDRPILENYYESPFGYLESDAVKSCKLNEVVLEKVYRQQDPGFISLLRGIRLNGLMPVDIETLNKRFNRNVNYENITMGQQIICSTNNKVNYYNHKMLDLIMSDEYCYEADVSSGYPMNKYPTNDSLKLKLGAKVMLLRNDKGRRYFNGSFGQVRALHEDAVVVEIDGVEVEVRREQWTYTRYRHDAHNREIVPEGATEYFRQMPLRLAWAMTTHKAQGQTFDKILCDLSDEFMPEQTYVALSRCRTLDGVTMLAALEAK